MPAYLLQRLVSLVLIVLGMTLIMFLITRALPGDPAVVAAGGMGATKETIARARQELGLDRPVLVQYARYLGGLVRGEFGRSIVTGRAVLLDLRERFPATLELTLAAIVFSTMVGIPLGVMAAVYRGRLADHLIRVLSLVMVSFPVFWIGLIAILVFYGRLRWFPAGARLGGGTTPPATLTGLYTVDALLRGDLGACGDALWHLTLPMVVLGSVTLAAVARLSRACMLEVLQEDYVRTARAKGLAERSVLYKHAFRNAAIPVVTVIGLAFGRLMGGAVLTETIFAWPGVGKFAVEAIRDQDFPVVMGFTVVFSGLYALVNLGTDLLYGVIDPRVAHGG